MIFRSASIMVFALVGCSGAASQRPPAQDGPAGNATTIVIPPNEGTAPDWLAICADQASRAFGLRPDDFHVDRQIDDRPDGIRIAEGHYDVPERRLGYRCLVDRDDRFIRIENLPSSMEPPGRP